MILFAWFTADAHLFFSSSIWDDFNRRGSSDLLKPWWAHLFVNGCLACVYFTGQLLALTKLAHQEAHTICAKWWMVEDNNYEEVRRSWPAQAAATLHSQVKPRVFCSAQALAHGGSWGDGLCMNGLDRHANEHAKPAPRHIFGMLSSVACQGMHMHAFACRVRLSRSRKEVQRASGAFCHAFAENRRRQRKHLHIYIGILWWGGIERGHAYL